jgi:WD40 repeat protein
VEGVAKITTTLDNKFLFAASNGGCLKQISLESQEVVHDYGQIHAHDITGLESTRDSKWLITRGYDNRVKRISVENRELENLGDITNQLMTAMKIAADGDRLLVGDAAGSLGLVSSRDGYTIKDFGYVHPSWISGIMMSVEEKFFFTSSNDGVLKQWSL